MRGGPVADRRLDPAALHPTATFVDGWLQARTRDWLAQVGTVALDPWRGYASALVAPLGHVTVLGDHVHAIRLANAVADQARRRMQQATMGHRGCTYDSLYRIRKLLVTAAEQLTQRGRARLRARDTMRIERGADRSANLDSTRWPLSWGSVTVPNHGSMRTRSAPATSKIRNSPGSSAGCHRRDWCRARRPLGATPDMKGWSVVTAGVGGRARVADLLVRPCPMVGRPRGGSLRSCRTTPLATCRWPG
jgi:Transposase